MDIRLNDFVYYWPGARNVGREPEIGRVTSEGFVDFGGTECYRISKRNGGSDYIAATHVEPLAHLLGDVAYVQTASQALAVCDLPGVEHVVVEDRAESIKLQRLAKGMRLA